MELMMACELAFPTPTEGETPQLPRCGVVGSAAGRWRGDTQPPPFSVVSFFFVTWPYLAIRKIRVLMTRTDETGLPPKHLFQEQEIAKRIGIFGDLKKCRDFGLW